MKNLKTTLEKIGSISRESEEKETNIYICEVGIELDKDEEEYQDYFVEKANKSLYDENIALFITLEEAEKYAQDYVQNGVVSTYAMIWKEQLLLTSEDIENIQNNGYCDRWGSYYQGQDLISYIKK